MASTAAMVFFCRLGRMSRSALLTGFLVCAGAVCAGAVCATADAASNNKAGITRVFIFFFSLCEKSIARVGGSALPHCGRNLQQSIAAELRSAWTGEAPVPTQAKPPTQATLRYPNNMHAHGGHGHSHGPGRV